MSSRLIPAIERMTDEQRFAWAWGAAGREMVRLKANGIADTRANILGRWIQELGRISAIARLEPGARLISVNGEEV